MFIPHFLFSVDIYEGISFVKGKISTHAHSDKSRRQQGTVDAR